MKVLLIHEHGRAHGSGAVTAMYRLHQGLKKLGVESVIGCRRRELQTPDIVELPRSDWLENILGMVSWRLGLNDVHCVSTFKMTRFKPFLEADIVNIHGFHTNFFNYLAVPRLAAMKPIVATMHDMWNITGHCSQSYECQRWKTGCGKCPHPEVFPPIGRDGTAIEWRLKNRVYRKSNMTFVAPSQWLLNLSRQSMIADYDVRQIVNPVDVEVYKPLDKRECRAKLGVPLDKHVIMFVSLSMSNWGKGGDLMLGALERLPESIKRNSVLLLLGEKSEEFAKASGIAAIPLGYIHDNAAKVQVYSAADVMVQPSRAENQSLVILEAMACGTPVVAFDTGGMGEIVLKGPGGILAESENVQQLANGIARVLSDRGLAEGLSRGGRQAVVENYSLDLHCRRYVELFQEKIEAFAARKRA